MNTLLTCTLVAAFLATLATAYNFEDSYYNQLLASEWEELHAEQSNINPRTRRDEDAVNADKCKRRRPKFCCADDVLEAGHEQDKPIKKECFKQVTGKEKPVGGFHGTDPFKCDKEKVDKHRKEIMCVMQCVGQKKDLLDAEGNLKEDNIRKQLKERYSGEKWLAAKIDELINKCIAEAKTAPPKTNKVDDEDACNEVGMRFGHCFWREFQLSCPADQIKDQKACDRVRERISNHPDFSFMPHRPGGDDE